jgi:hypothetical protein
VTALVAQYATAGTGRVTVVETATTAPAYTAHCSGCRAGTTESAADGTAGPVAKNAAVQWAKRHAIGCHAPS